MHYDTPTIRRLVSHPRESSLECKYQDETNPWIIQGSAKRLLTRNNLFKSLDPSKKGISDETALISVQFLTDEFSFLFFFPVLENRVVLLFFFRPSLSHLLPHLITLFLSLFIPLFFIHRSYFPFSSPSIIAFR